MGNQAGKNSEERQYQHCTFLKSSAEPVDATFPSLPVKNPGDGAWFQSCQGIVPREQSWLASGNSHIQGNTVGRGAMDAVAMLAMNQPIPFIWDQIHPISFPSVSLHNENYIPIIFQVASLPVHVSHFSRDNIGSIQLWLPCWGIPIAAHPLQLFQGILEKPHQIWGV